MMKKTFLGLLITASTLATAHINLNVNMTVMNDGTERHTTHNILVEENVHTPIMFESEEPVIIDFLAETDGANVDITVQFFQQTKEGEMITATEPLTTQTPFNQPTTVTVHESDNEENGVTLVITPTVL